ncbi:hypothetical protein Tco_0085093 [Tanacetum coccineum]
MQSLPLHTQEHTKITGSCPTNEHVLVMCSQSVHYKKDENYYSEKGFLSALYEGRVTQDLHDMSFGLFLRNESHVQGFPGFPKSSHPLLCLQLDSDYAGATQDRKSTTRGCQFLGNRTDLLAMQETNVDVTSTTDAEKCGYAS